MGGIVDAIFGGNDAPSMPATDPNVGAAATANAKVAADSLAFNKQMYEENKPRQAELDALSRKYVAAATQSQEQNAEYAKGYHDRMTSTFYPIEDTLAAEASTAGGAADQEKQAGLARGDVIQANQNGLGQMTRTAESYGINPNSGRFMSNLSDQTIANAAIEAGAMNHARDAAKQLGWSKKADVASMGRGLASNQATSAGIALQSGNAGMGYAQAPISSALGIQQAGNQGFNTAISGYNSQGQLGLGATNAQMQGWGKQLDANAAESAGMGNMLGTLGSAALSYAGTAAGSAALAGF